MRCESESGRLQCKMLVGLKSGILKNFHSRSHSRSFPGITMHYRLRGSIGFLNAQKKFKSKRLFLTQGTPKYDNFAIFVKNMTQICTKKISQLFQIANMAKIMVNVQKRLNGASVKADFWHGENKGHPEKKSSKQRCSTRPASRWNQGLKAAIGILQIFVHQLLGWNIWTSSICPFFLTELIEKCSFCPHQI